MKTKALSFLLLSLFLLLNACSPLSTVVSESGQQPMPVESYDVPSTDDQPITVDQVEVETSQPLIPATWVTYNSANPQCGYAISYPPEMQAAEQTPYSQILRFNLPDSDAGIPNFIYMSVVTPEIQKMVEDGVYNHDVYNYDPAATSIMVNMQSGESKSVHPVPDMETGFTFERKLDTQISGYIAQTYENIHPWEFPSGTKEIRYLLSLDGCIYLIGGYVDTTQSNQPGAIMEDLFHQIIATMQVTP